MDAEIREKGYVSVTSRLNSNKKLASEIVRAVKAERKVWLIFVNGHKQCTPDVYRGYKTTSELPLISFEVMCDNKGMVIDFSA